MNYEFLTSLFIFFNLIAWENVPFELHSRTQADQGSAGKYKAYSVLIEGLQEFRTLSNHSPVLLSTVSNEKWLTVPAGAIFIVNTTHV